MSRIKLVILLLLFLLPSIAFGAPVISGVNYSGDLTHNKDITIGGSNFGSGPNIILYEDGEVTGDSSATLPSGTTPGSVLNLAASKGSWNSTSGGWNGATGIKYDSEHVDGSYGIRMYDPGVGHNQAYVQFPGTQKFYYSFWFLWPEDTPEHMASANNCLPYGTTDGASGNDTNINYCKYIGDKVSVWKFAWIQDALHGSPIGTDDDIVIISKGSSNLLYNDGNDTARTSSAILDYEYDALDNHGDPNEWWYRHGKWVRVTFSLLSDDTDLTGNAKIYFQAIPYGETGHMFEKTKNITNMYSTHNDLDSSDPPQEFNRLYTLGWMRAYAMPNCRMAMDDIYLSTGSNAAARVELGDQSTYSQCGKLWIMPINSWSSSSISANIQTGTLTNGTTGYIYVTDADGNHSAGYAVTIDQAGTPPPASDPTVSISATDPTATEEGTTTGTVSIDCDETTSGDCDSLQVSYSISGSATITDDYTASDSDGTITITDKDTPATITVTPVDDSVVESTETVTFTLSDGASYNLSSPTAATVSITDNDTESFSGELFGNNVESDHANTGVDTYTNSGQPTNNFDASDSLRVYTWPLNTCANTSLLKFDLSSIDSNSTVSSATLYLYMTGYEGTESGDYYLTASKIINKSPDYTAVTWNKYNTTQDWTSGGGLGDIAAYEDEVAVSPTIGWVAFDVTNMVQDWVTYPGQNYGVLIASDQVAGHEAPSDADRIFASGDNASTDIRPILGVTYSAGSGESYGSMQGNGSGGAQGNGTGSLTSAN